VNSLNWFLVVYGLLLIFLASYGLYWASKSEPSNAEKTRKLMQDGIKDIFEKDFK
jgi:protein-S-isoprenylcysteine O-methyltransferase Ste14